MHKRVLALLLPHDDRDHIVKHRQVFIQVLLGMLRTHQQHVEERHDQQPVVPHVGMGEFKQPAKSNLGNTCERVVSSITDKMEA